MARIFISYRRSDSRTISGRIYDRLATAFGGAEYVFKDVDSIPFGADFRTYINDSISACDALMAIIGPTWVTTTDEQGRRRIDDPNDFVRLEIEAALEQNLPVYPVLVHGAAMPRADDLPESLQSLAYRNAASVRDDPDFHRDMDRLIHDMQVALNPPPSPVEAAAPRPTSSSPSRGLITGAVAAVVVVVLVIALLASGVLSGGDGDGKDTNGDTQDVAQNETPAPAHTQPAVHMAINDIMYSDDYTQFAIVLTIDGLEYINNLEIVIRDADTGAEQYKDHREPAVTLSVPTSDLEPYAEYTLSVIAYDADQARLAEVGEVFIFTGWEATTTPEPTHTSAPTATQTTAPTNTPEPTLTETLHPTNTSAPTATQTVRPTKTPEPTLTDTPPPTNTPEPTLTDTPSPTSTSEIGTVDHPLMLFLYPGTDVEQLTAAGEQFSAALSAATGYEIEVFVPTSYTGVLEAFCYPEYADVTMGTLLPEQYVLAQEQCGAQLGGVAVRFGWPVFWEAYLVRRDAGITSLDDLAGKVWGYSDLLSQAYVLPSVELLAAGIMPGDEVITGGHNQTVLAVYNGEVDFGTTYFMPPINVAGEGVWDYGDDPEPYSLARDISRIREDGALFVGDWRIMDARYAVRETAPDIVDHVEILALIGPYPNEMFVFGAEVPEDVRTAIMDALNNDLVGTALWNDTLGQYYNWSSLEPLPDNMFDLVRLRFETGTLTEDAVRDY